MTESLPMQRFVARIGEEDVELEVGFDGTEYVVREAPPRSKGNGSDPDSGDGHGSSRSSSARRITWASLPGGRVLVRVDGRPLVLRIRQESGEWQFDGDSRRFHLTVTDEMRARALRSREEAMGGATGPVDIQSPMPGTVVKVLANEGDAVEAGRAVFIIEAMKMQNEVPAPISGTVADLRGEAGKPVDAHEVLCRIVP